MILRCLGNINYWKDLVHLEPIEFSIHHTFQKQSSLSQFEIMNANGRQKLSIPTLKNTRKGMYDKVKIDYSSNWQLEHWRSIEIAYLKSPFYLYYGYKIEEAFKQRFETLLAFNLAINSVILKCLKLNHTSTLKLENAVYFSEMENADHIVYPQVFDTKMPFEKNLCILDLLFNLGPETVDYLKQIP